MNNVLAVQIMHSKTELDENFPNKVLNQSLSILFADVSVQVAMLAVLLNDVYRTAVYKRVVIAYHIVRVKFTENFNLLESFKGSLFG